jgi:hypothetical protein
VRHAEREGESRAAGAQGSTWLFVLFLVSCSALPPLCGCSRQPKHHADVSRAESGTTGPVLLAKVDVDREPSRIWNAFVDLVGTSDYEVLTPEQRPAHLVFLYESEVQNGGHLQYFENHHGARLDETVAALGLLDAACQQDVLRDAGVAWRSRQRAPLRSVEEYRSDAFDHRLSACSPTLTDRLEAYLAAHRSAFVTIVP